MGHWKKGEPRDAVARGNWYSVFHDSKLNQIEAEAQVQNQNLRAAIARGERGTRSGARGRGRFLSHH